MSVEYIALELMEEMFTIYLEMSIFGTGGVEGPRYAPEAASRLVSGLDDLPLPKPQRPSTPEGVDEGLECKICFGNEIDIRFKECTHGACAACALGIWKSKVEKHNLLPSWFPCHLCRAEVGHLGALARVCDGGGLDSGERVSMSCATFWVSEWVGIKEWVGGLSEEWDEYVGKASEVLGNTRQGLEGSGES